MWLNYYWKIGDYYSKGVKFQTRIFNHTFIILTKTPLEEIWLQIQHIMLNKKKTEQNNYNIQMKGVLCSSSEGTHVSMEYRQIFKYSNIRILLIHRTAKPRYQYGKTEYAGQQYYSEGCGCIPYRFAWGAILQCTSTDPHRLLLESPRIRINSIKSQLIIQDHLFRVHGNYKFIKHGVNK